jgi:hypothetical protein
MDFHCGAQKQNQSAAEIFFETVCFHNLPFHQKIVHVLVRPPAANTAAVAGAADSSGGGGRAHRGCGVHSPLLERAVLRR